MKLLNWIKNLFKKESPKAEAPVKLPTIIEIPEPIEPKPSKRFKIAFARGHGGNDSGASGNGIVELEYITWVMNNLEARNLADVSFHYGDNSVSAMLKAMMSGADLIVQMHVNAASATAFGSEACVVKGDHESYKYGQDFCMNLNKRFNKPTRREATKGLKILDSGDRGVKSLVIAKTFKKFIAEPFFLSNKSDIIPKEEYADFWADQIKQWQS